VAENNRVKAAIVYDAIESSGGFYHSPVDRACRSKMNVPFTIPSSPDAEKAFVAEAGAAGMKELKGHRSVGGMRASIYNAMPLEGVQALADFMKAFAAKHKAA
jgi:phosphoserine aminotransferase